jgi:transposase
MSVTTIGLDLAKSVFQVHGVDAGGHAVLKRRVRRQGLLAFFEEPPPCLVGMEACSSAHYWARELVGLWHDVRLIPPQYVKRNKTDAADAEAICEAVGHLNMRFIPVKTVESHGLLTPHRVRSLLVRHRTATVNAARGLLSEFGIVAAKGIRRVDDLRRDMEGTNEKVLPREARTALDAPFDHLDALTAKPGEVDREVLAWHGTSEASQRLATAPDVGPLTATALIAAVGDASQFTSARHFAAWLGLTPRISASGNRDHVGRISKGGDRYLRTLLTHGARAMVGTSFRRGLRPRPWLRALIARCPVNVAAVAVAHKTARALWAMIRREEAYRHPATFEAAA